MAQVYDEPIVVRLTQPVGPYPVGSEFGFDDLAQAIRALGSSSYFTVVRTQDGDPIPPPTPEDMTEAEKQALARARAARLIRGSEFDPLVPGPGEVIVGGADGPVAAPLPLGQNLPNLVVSMGDSITSNSGTPPLQTDRGYLSWASMFSNSRIRWGRPYATGGHRTDQIMSDHLPQVLGADPKPGWCVVLAGSNDVMQDVPVPTIAANLTTMYEALVGAGIRPVCCTLPPNNGATGTRRTALGAINTWIAGYAQANGLPLVDIYGALADPATGDFRTGLDADGVHPTAAGAELMGEAIADVIAPLVTPSVPPLATANDGAGLAMANPLLLNDSNADGIPDGWTRLGTPTGTTHTLEPAPGEVVGNWLHMGRAGDPGASTGLTLRGPVVPVTPGDRILLGFRAKCEGLDEGDHINVGFWQISPAGPSLWRPLYTWTRGFGPTTFAFEAVVPEGMSNVQFNATITTLTGTLSIGQVTVRNITALGLA